MDVSDSESISVLSAVSVSETVAVSFAISVSFAGDPPELPQAAHVANDKKITDLFFMGSSPSSRRRFKGGPALIEITASLQNFAYYIVFLFKSLFHFYTLF